LECLEYTKKGVAGQEKKPQKKNHRKKTTIKPQEIFLKLNPPC
jgi:hypothetical protein